jgi:hypothetical protein
MELVWEKDSNRRLRIAANPKKLRYLLPILHELVG